MLFRILLALFLVSASLLWGQQTSSTPVTRQEAWQAIVAYLRGRGVAEEQVPRPVEIELPGTILASHPRTLRVSSVCWDSQLQRAAFRLECSEAGACIPFLVYGAIEPRSFRQLRLSAEAGAICSERPGPPPRKAVRKQVAVRPGDRATVVFRGDQMQLSVQVTCLERGAEGEIVRVRNADGGLFRARVIGPDLLEALTND